MSRKKEGECFGMSRKKEDECFGLPQGSSIFWLLIGVIIIIWGISELFEIDIEFWPSIIVIFGIMVVAGALYKLTTKKR